MRKRFFVSLFLAALFCGTFTSAVLAKENGTEECDAVVLENRVVLREKPQIGGLVFVGDYDVLDKLESIARIIGSYGVPIIEYKGLQDGGVEITFSIHPVK